MQTNLTILDQDIIDLIKNYNFKIGVSCDGPGILTDFNRRFKKNDHISTSTVIEEHMRTLKEHSIPFSVNCVITRLNIGFITELYTYFEELGVSFQISPVIPNSKYPELTISPESYGRALISLFDLWFKNRESNITIINFEQYISGLLDGHIKSCQYSGDCTETVLRVSCNGSVYPCWSSPSKQVPVGSLLSMSLDEIIGIIKERGYKNTRMELLNAECHNCIYKDFCRGGCPRNNLDENILHKDYYCRAYQSILNHISSKLGVN